MAKVKIVKKERDPPFFTNKQLIALCDKVCQCLVADPWFFLDTAVSSTSKTDCHDITEILLKVAFNTITTHHPHEGPHFVTKVRATQDNLQLYIYYSVYRVVI
jgi:hypothetical protein